MKMTQRFLALSGLVAAFGLAHTASAQELIANGGFESGNFSGWTVTGSSAGVYYNGGNDPTLHNYRAAFITGPVTLYQDIATVAGQSYNFGFTNEVDGGSNNAFSALFGAQNVYSVSTGSQDFTPRTFLVTASSALTRVSFTFSGGSFQNFDNVTVTAAAVPEAASWAMMILGMGAVGYAMRSRKAVVRVARVA